MKLLTKTLGAILMMLTLSLNVSAEGELFFKGLKNAYRLNPKSIPESDGQGKDVKVPYTQLADRLKGVKIINAAGDDFWLCLEPKTTNFYVVNSMDCFSHLGNDPDAEEAANTRYENEYEVGFYDFDNDKIDEIVVVGRSNKANHNDMSIFVVFASKYKPGVNSADINFDKKLYENMEGVGTAEIKDGVIKVTPANPSVKLEYDTVKWNGSDFEIVWPEE